MIQTQFRYSHHTPERTELKNVLATVRDGDFIYYGIARCRIRGKKRDQFDKTLGRHIALCRAQKAINEDLNTGISFGSNYGVINVANVKELIQFFRTVK